MRAGPSEPAGMGDAPLSWGTLRAWSELTETPLSPADYEALRELSAEWVHAADEYRHKNVPAPWDADPDETRADQSARIKSLFRGLMAAQQAAK